MRIDLLPPEMWETLNDRVRPLVKVANDCSVRVHPGLQASIYETVMGIAQFFSHKKACGVIKGATPYFEGVMPYLFKDGYQVQAMKLSEWGNFKAWMDALKKDTNFVLVPEDHPVTGEIYDWDPIDAILNEKKIFSIRLSHFNHFRGNENLRPYSVRINSLSQKLSVVVGGNKFKSPPLISHKMHWDVEKTSTEIQKLLSAFTEDQSVVEAFEKKIQADSSMGLQVLPIAGQRVWDRSLIFSAAINGEALENYLFHPKYGRFANPPGAEYEFESTSLCRWGGISLFENWWENKPAVEVLRGMVILSVESMKRSEILNELKAAVGACQISFEVEL